MEILSIDIETTGLDPETCQIIEFGCVFYDTQTDSRKENHWVLTHSKYSGEPYALQLNQRIFKLIVDNENMLKHERKLSVIVGKEDEHLKFKARRLSYNVISIDFLVGEFSGWLTTVCGVDKDKKINVIGKNYASFDKLFLDKLPGWKNINLIFFNRRILDPSILFLDLDTDETLPNLEECKKRAGWANSTVSHKAVDDANDVLDLFLHAKKSCAV